MTEDQTLKKELEKYKKENEAQRYALDQSAIVAITNARGVITYVNDFFCKVSEYSRDELVGKTHTVVNSGFHTQEFFREMWSELSEGKVWRGEIRNRSKSGSHYWVDTTIVPFLDEGGEPYQYVSIRYDVTSRKKAEASLEDERLRLLQSEKMASLGVMASGIAHELGNPLSALRGRIEMFSENESVSPEDREKFCARTLSLVDRINRIVKGLRAYARDGEKDPFKKTSLRALVEDLLELVEGRCRKLNIKLDLEVHGEDHYCECREAEIGQVIVNLVNNSIDAIERCSEKWIRIELTSDPAAVKFSVTDSGVGVPSGLEEKIFTPFFTTKSPGQGTGLGLSISRNIILSHHGEFSWNKLSVNTQFYFIIPKNQ